MKTYAKYYHKSVTSDELIPLCGSDSVLPLDGRLNWRNAVNAAKSHANSLNKRLGKDIKGFILYRGRTMSEALDQSPQSSMQTI